MKKLLCASLCLASFAGSAVAADDLTQAVLQLAVQQARRDLARLGVSDPTPEQLAAALLHPPTREELAVAALPPQVRAALDGLPPKEALRAVELADQHLAALGVSAPSAEQVAEKVTRVRSGGYVEASAGATSFPPLSPLVAPPLWQP